MRKIRAEYSTEFIEKITESFLSDLGDADRISRVRAELVRVREKNHDALFLEMSFALKNVIHQESLEASRKLIEVIDLDDAIKALFDEELRLANILLAYSESKPSEIAKSGGDGRAEKLKVLENETIRLYKIKLEHRESKGSPNMTRKRTSIPLDAQEITPLIVKLSTKNGVNLLPTTTRPLAWLRAFVKSQKSSAS